MRKFSLKVRINGYEITGAGMKYKYIENLSLGSAQVGSNRSAQLQSLARGLPSICIYLYVYYYLGSKQKMRWSDYSDTQAVP